MYVLMKKKLFKQFHLIVMHGTQEMVQMEQVIVNQSELKFARSTGDVHYSNVQKKMR